MKLRLDKEMDSGRPMRGPFHIHGAGRFLVLSRDGVTEPNLVWKDTVLIRTGETVDILLDVTNPGRWMAHCHIAEHHESGMMLTFTVRARSAVRRGRSAQLTSGPMRPREKPERPADPAVRRANLRRVLILFSPYRCGSARCSR